MAQFFAEYEQSARECIELLRFNTQRIYTTRSITTNRSKKFENSVGYFDYVTVNDTYINFKHTGLSINIS